METQIIANGLLKMKLSTKIVNNWKCIVKPLVFECVNVCWTLAMLYTATMACFHPFSHSCVHLFLGFAHVHRSHKLAKLVEANLIDFCIFKFLCVRNKNTKANIASRRLQFFFCCCCCWCYCLDWSQWDQKTSRFQVDFDRINSLIG